MNDNNFCGFTNVTDTFCMFCLFWSQCYEWLDIFEWMNWDPQILCNTQQPSSEYNKNIAQLFHEIRNHKWHKYNTNNSGIPEVTKIEFSYSLFLTCTVWIMKSKRPFYGSTLSSGKIVSKIYTKPHHF